MEKILFTHSYFLRFDPKQWKLGQPYPPLGTIYAAALMREKGFQVSLQDSMFSLKASDIRIRLQLEQPKYFVVYDDGFNYLTKMCLTNMREAAFAMIHWAKLKHCIVIFSSSDATDHYEKYLGAGADYVIIGEAEYSLLELVETLEIQETILTPNSEPLAPNPELRTPNTLDHIAGISYKGFNGFVKTQKRNVIKDLDSLPLPAWDLLDLEPYKKMWKKSTGYFSLNIATTRGCPFRCNWCAKPIYGNRYNVRSPMHVVNELKMLKSNYGFDHIWFCDDIFGLHPGWVKEFAWLLKNENLHLRFKIQSRADLLLQENYVEALAEAGCETVWMGAESGSQKILDAMDKGITVNQIAEATKLLRKYGIRPCFFIQFGYLDENNGDIEATIEMIHRLLPDEIGISISYPLPGTKFYEKVKQQLKWKANWTDSNELALMFQNKQSPSFYKQLHKYVHKSYRKQLAIYQAVKILRNPLRLDLPSIKKILSGIYYIPASIIARSRLRHLQNFK